MNIANKCGAYNIIHVIYITYIIPLVKLSVWNSDRVNT